MGRRTHRLRVRAELSAPIIAQFHAWLEALAPQVLPQSLLGKAVYYTLGQWPLTQGEAPLDNIRCENAIRPFVVGRKGWLFSDTVKGAVASANLFSIVETAKANGGEPHAYLSPVRTAFLRQDRRRLRVAVAVECYVFLDTNCLAKDRSLLILTIAPRGTVTMDRHSLFKTALDRCMWLQTQHPATRALQSIVAQLEYLIALETGRSSNRTRLKDVNIGVLAAREVEDMDMEVANEWRYLLHRKCATRLPPSAQERGFLVAYLH